MNGTMKIVKKKDFFFGIVVLLFGIGLFVFAEKFVTGSFASFPIPASSEPEFYSRIIAGIIIVSSAIIILGSISFKKNGQNFAPVPDQEDAEATQENLNESNITQESIPVKRRVSLIKNPVALVIIVTLLIYGFILKPLGFYAATIPFLTVLCFVFMCYDKGLSISITNIKENWKVFLKMFVISLVFSAVITVAMGLLFVKVLKARLP